MNFKEIIDEITKLEENLSEENDNKISLSLLKAIKEILNQEQKKNSIEIQIKNELDIFLDTFLDRPDDYFQSKEVNIQKMIDKKLSISILPTTEESRKEVFTDLNISTLLKLLNKTMLKTKKKENIELLQSCKKQVEGLKNYKNKKQYKNLALQTISDTKAIMKKIAESEMQMIIDDKTI